MPALALGLDSSTQSLSAAVIEIESGRLVFELSVDYLSEPRTAGFGIGGDYLLPPLEDGDARQPVAMYFASLDILFTRLRENLPELGFNISDIAAIDVSGQQHGHVLLGRQAEAVFSSLDTDTLPEAPLENILAPALAVPWARIWRTSNTRDEAATVRRRVGGSEQLIAISGSDGPLRFSAFGIRKTARSFPDVWANTAMIHQISSLLPALLAGRLNIPLDWGNACGSSLMDYRRREWSSDLLDAVSSDLPGGAPAFRSRLPGLSSALTPGGPLAHYFRKKYGFNSDCMVGIGSGDNPMTKVLAPGSLLSLGTSFVIMANTGAEAIDSRGWANAMYDGLDRPFCFGCRTNGALRWDEVRAMHGLGRRDYAPADDALEGTPPGNDGRLMVWYREVESFPPAPASEPLRFGYDNPELAADYTGIVESSLASLFLNSRHFMAPGGELYVTGGPSGSRAVLRRVAAVFGRPAVSLASGGAALGAAAVAACLYLQELDPGFDPAAYCGGLLERGEEVVPSREALDMFHGERGMMNAYLRVEEKLRGS